MDEQKKTTMSVPEMRRMLGLGKTDSYWLVHKNCFDTIMVEGKMRIVTESFEHWYANQIKHRKVDGPPPGEELRAYSYSVREMAEVLGVTEDIIYSIIKRDSLETFEVDTWMRIRKDVFETWYQSQTKYRTAEDRERDKELEEASYTMPEMARLLLISRKEVYNILSSSKNEGVFETIVVADKKRVTKDSFEAWYAGQSRYRKLCDRPAEEIAVIERKQQEAEHPRLKVDENKDAFTLQEAAVLLDLTYAEIRKLIQSGEFDAKKYGNKYMIPRGDITWFLFQQKLERENEKGVTDDGIHCTEE